MRSMCDEQMTTRPVVSIIAFPVVRFRVSIDVRQRCPQLRTRGIEAANAEDLYQPTTGRLSGLTPFSFAAGAMPVVRDENVSANVLMGDFGPEIALVTEAAERSNVPTLGGTDDLPAQAILYTAAQEPLIGEELFAAGAYLGAGPSHAASLTVQDILRWALILFLLVGAALKMLGVI